MQWGTYGQEDIKKAFCQEGHMIIDFSFPADRELEYIEGDFTLRLHEDTPDIVFSIDYFPVISELCNRNHIRYISWIYDSPYIDLFHESVYNPCNTVYVFDTQLCMECRKMGMSMIYYLPLAADTDRLDQIILDSGKTADVYDISFVGSLYLENCYFYLEMEKKLPEYARGYLQALAAAQMKIEGYNFIQELLGPVIDDMSKAYKIFYDPGYMEYKSYMYAQYFVNEWLTTMGRIDMLTAIGQNHRVDLFTDHADIELSGVDIHGKVDYYTEMPLVFNQSKINLNITRRGIQRGMPLRSIDIMGSGGFLLTNYQADFLEHFVPGEDFVYYDSKEDLLRKVDYYLSHDEERQAIAKNGHDKIAAAHTYRHRVREMLDGLC